jgi:serine/threonine-protein kinase
VQVALALPGGNPLQVALEAGETPTPEMVAAAPVKGILRPSVAIGMLAFVIAVVGLSFYFSSTYSAAGQTPFERSPEALAERARTIIRDFGYSETPNDSHYEIGLDPSYKSFVKTQENPNSWWEKIETGQPFHYYFWYRQSPQQLLPLGTFKKIGIKNPPVTVPGMINVKLDMKGRLIEFKAVPPSQVLQNTSTGKIDWQKVFGEAGLDLAKFEEVDPKLNPTVFFDENREWKGTLSDHPDIPLRIRAAAFNGRLVEFRAIPDWKESSDLAGQTNNSGGSSWLFVVTAGIIWIIYLGSLFLAYRNWKKGRTDISGTIKLALFGMLPNFLFYLILTDGYALDQWNVMNPISSIAPSALEAALWLSIFYLALEPFVRRYWSDLLISWNRILKGDFRNPIIGRDILVGFFLYAIAHSISIGGEFLVTALNPALIFDRFDAVSSLPLNGTANVAALILAYLPFSLIAAFMLFPPLVIGHLIFKKKSTVLITLFLFFSIQTVVGVIDGSRAGRYEDLFIESVWLVLIFWASFRYGFVAAFAYFLLYGLLTQLTVSIDPSRYYFSSTVILAVTILVMAVYACYISMGNQFGKAWLKDD